MEEVKNFIKQNEYNKLYFTKKTNLIKKKSCLIGLIILIILILSIILFIFYTFVKRASSEIIKKEYKYNKIENKYSFYKNSLNNTEDKLNYAKNKLKNKFTYLNDKKNSFNNTKIKLNNTEIELNNAEIELNGLDSKKIIKINFNFNFREIKFNNTRNKIKNINNGYNSFENYLNNKKNYKNNLFNTKTNFKYKKSNLNINKSRFSNVLPKISLKSDEVPSLYQIFNSRELFISDGHLTLDYIHFIRPIDCFYEKKFKEPLYPNFMPDISFTKNRPNQIELHKFYNICRDEKLISDEKIEYHNRPLISILVPSYNKADMILKSIRSIQNQSFKNIEIIIVNDCSTDNSTKIFNYLLKTDPRIRIFNHLKNMGAWRSRLDGFLYSRAPYILHFDAGDYYTDNLILEDAYKLVTKYNLDSLRFSFKLSRKKEDIDFESWNFTFKPQDRKIVYGRRSYNMLLYAYGPIWNRITRANIFTKGLDLLDEYILNAYKNLYEDRWWNTFANNVSYSYCMVNRVGYIYLRVPGGAGVIRHGDNTTNEKTMKEFVYFWIFDYLMLDEKNDKKTVIENLYKFNGKDKNYHLNDLKNYFPPYIHLLDLLINDAYIKEKDRDYIKALKFNTIKKFKLKQKIK